MGERDAKLAVVREWIAKAENDLTAAVQILKLGQAAPTDTVCFHAQQCVEKYLKALLVFHAKPFSKTHNIRVLMVLLPPATRPAIEEHLQDLLTEYAAVTRYPEAGLDIALSAARKAVALARLVRRQVRRQLPKQALRRRKRSG